MTTNARIGHGITVELASADSPTAWVSIGEVTDLSPPSMSRDTPDATHFASPNRYREFIGGLRDAGEISAELNYVPGSAGDDQLLEAYNDDEAWPLKITFVGGDTWEADVFLTSYEPGSPLDDKMTLSVTFKITGEPTFTDAA